MKFLLIVLTFFCSLASAGTAVTKTFDSIHSTGGSALSIPSTAIWPVGSGGLGVANPTANSLLVGNGSSAVSLIAPGTSGNVLISNGTSWASTANPATPIMIVSRWFEDGNSAVPINENNTQVFSWTAGNGQVIFATITIPFTYSSGVQITLRTKFYSPTYVSGNDLMQTVSTLNRTGTDAITSTTNQRTSTNTAVTPAGANIPYLVSFDLTDSTGKINGVTVSAGDTIIVQLTRGTDTDVGEIHGLTLASEILY